MAFTDYLAMLQQPQQQTAPDANSSGANMLMQALQRKQQFDLQEAERQRLAADRERTRAKEERAAKESRLKAAEEYVDRMARSGQGEAAVNAYKQVQGLRTDLYGPGMGGPDIVGGIDPSGAYDLKTKQPLRNYNDRQTLGMLQMLNGDQVKPIDVAPFHTVIDPYTHKPLYTAPGMVGSDRTGRQFYQPGLGGSPAMPPAVAGPVAGPTPAAGGPVQVTAPVAPAARSSGGGRRSSGGGGRGGPSSGGKPMKQSEVNAVLSTVNKLKAAVVQRHKSGSDVDWEAVDIEWRPKAEAILRSKGLNPNDYLPATSAIPGQGRVYGPPSRPTASQQAPKPQQSTASSAPPVRSAPSSNGMRFKINSAELSPRVASILNDLGMA